MTKYCVAGTPAPHPSSRTLFDFSTYVYDVDDVFVAGDLGKEVYLLRIFGSRKELDQFLESFNSLSGNFLSPFEILRCHLVVIVCDYALQAFVVGGRGVCHLLLAGLTV